MKEVKQKYQNSTQSVNEYKYALQLEKEISLRMQTDLDFHCKSADDVRKADISRYSMHIKSLEELLEAAR